jgi:hypothetical protein
VVCDENGYSAGNPAGKQRAQKASQKTPPAMR